MPRTNLLHAYTPTHTYTQSFSRKRIFPLREIRNFENHRNLGVEKFHRYQASLWESKRRRKKWGAYFSNNMIYTMPLYIDIQITWEFFFKYQLQAIKMRLEPPISRSALHYYNRSFQNFFEKPTLYKYSWALVILLGTLST